MLILFDVDATLISTSGVGMRAMEDAAAALLGLEDAAGQIEYAGGLDPLIIGDFFRLAGREATAEASGAFREAYRTNLVRRLADPGTVARALPGVLALLDRLGGIDAVTIGLLTGNFPETGSIKLRACGIDPDRFEIAVWGEDSPHSPPDRAHLPPVAMARYGERFGRPVDRRQVVIIGDTPHDVRCARGSGCRSLGVATGRSSAGDLEAAGADRVVSDLAETDDILRWLVG